MNPRTPALTASMAVAVLTLLALLLGPTAATAAETPSLAEAASAATAATAATDEERALAERFSPVVMLVTQDEPCGPGEAYQPTDVDALLPHPDVALRGPWDEADLIRVGPRAGDLSAGLTGYYLDFPGNPLSPGCDYETWAERVTGGTAPTMYAHVATEQGRRDRLALQYWFYYPFNDYNNKHESDWEMIQLLFDTGEVGAALDRVPVQVAYSQHEGAEVADWDDPKLDIVDDTHPVVHVAAGSHANFFDPALHLGSSGEQGFGCDDTRTPSDATLPAVAVIPTDPKAARRAFPWITYEGRWGQRLTAFYNGPTGPNVKSQWTQPVTFQEAEVHDRSFAVPAGGALGTGTTDFFCNGVEGGSDLLRTLINSPGLLLLAAGIALLAIAWLVRRTTWRPTTPFHLHRNRSGGQILAAAARVYRGHWRVFASIGAALIPVVLVVSSLQALVVSAPEMAGVSTGGEDGGLRVTVAAALGFLVLGMTTVTVLAASTVVLFRLDAGEEIGLRRAFADALARWRRLAVAFVTTSVLVGLSSLTVFLSPLALALMLAFALYVPVIVVEGLDGIAALRRSASLVRHEALKIAVLLVTSVTTAIMLGPILGAVLLLVAHVPFIVVNVLAGAAFAVLLPYVALTIGFAYADAVVTRHRASTAPQQQPRVLPAQV